MNKITQEQEQSICPDCPDNIAFGESEGAEGCICEECDEVDRQMNEIIAGR